MSTDDESAFHHIPVLLPEVLDWLASVPAGLVVDATVGGAGHATAILESRSDLRLLGLDRDAEAVAAATLRLQRFEGRASVRHARFDTIAAEVRALQADIGPLPVVAILLDLGVSSVQFDRGERGFSYRHDAPLDMRMDASTGTSAADLVATATVAELRHILRSYGDERFADRIARAIVAHRPIETTAQLADIVRDAIPAAARRTGGHPAKRTFQALRIAVNDELALLEATLDTAIDLLATGGRVIVLSYHSGEDRIVKEHFRSAATGDCSCPADLPCVCGALPRGRMVRRGVTRPTPAEVAANPRAASALARVFERSTTDPAGEVLHGVLPPSDAPSAPSLRDPAGAGVSPEEHQLRAGSRAVGKPNRIRPSRIRPHHSPSVPDGPPEDL